MTTDEDVEKAFDWSSQKDEAKAFERAVRILLAEIMNPDDGFADKESAYEYLIDMMPDEESQNALTKILYVTGLAKEMGFVKEFQFGVSKRGNNCKSEIARIKVEESVGMTGLVRRILDALPDEDPDRIATLVQFAANPEMPEAVRRACYDDIIAETQSGKATREVSRALHSVGCPIDISDLPDD